MMMFYISVGENPVGKVFDSRAPDGSDEQFQQLPVNVEGGHVALGRGHGRAPADCHSILQLTSQGFVLSQRGMLQ